MRLRLFRARSMADVIRLVRAELGPEALILSSKRVKDGVELTVGLDTDESPVSMRVRQGSEGEQERQETSSLDTALAFHGVSIEMRRRLTSGPLPFAISAALRFAALPMSDGERPLVLIGPPGGGKTLSTARIATRLVLAGSRPLVITTDGQRAGATEQLAAFTRVLGLKLLLASTPEAIQRAMAHRFAGAPVLVDTTGVDPFNSQQCAVVSDLASAVDGRMVAVLPAGMDSAEATDVALALRALGAGLLVATRLDVARRVGSILAAAEAGLVLAEAGIGPGAADGMVPLTPDLLARRLLQVPRFAISSQSEFVS